MVPQGRLAAPLAGPAGRGGVARARWPAAAAAARSARPNGGAEVRGAGRHGQRGGAAAGLGGAHHEGRLGLLREVREQRRRWGGGGCWGARASTPGALCPPASSPRGSVRGAAAAAPSARGGAGAAISRPVPQGRAAAVGRLGPGLVAGPVSVGVGFRVGVPSRLLGAPSVGWAGLSQPPPPRAEPRGLSAGGEAGPEGREGSGQVRLACLEWERCWGGCGHAGGAGVGSQPAVAGAGRFTALRVESLYVWAAEPDATVL